MLLATLNSVTAMVRSWPWHSTRPSRWALASKWFDRFDERDAGLLGQRLGHAAAEFGMRVDAGADGRAAGGQFQHGVDRSLGPLDRQFELPGEAAEFLAQAQRRGVGQVRAADLDDLVPLLRPCRPARRASARAPGSARSRSPWPTAT